MTRTPADITDDLKELSKAYPPLQQQKYERRYPRLERMSNFYMDKAPNAPGGQGRMFYDFVSALMYAMSIIKMYQRLTTKLAKLAEEADENRTSS